MEHVELTEAILSDGMSRNGGWSRKQFQCLGVKWQKRKGPKKGWKAAILGRLYPKKVIENFLALKDTHLEPEDAADVTDHLSSIAREF